MDDTWCDVRSPIRGPGSGVHRPLARDLWLSATRPYSTWSVERSSVSRATAACDRRDRPTAGRAFGSRVSASTAGSSPARSSPCTRSASFALPWGRFKGSSPGGSSTPARRARRSRPPFGSGGWSFHARSSTRAHEKVLMVRARPGSSSRRSATSSTPRARPAPAPDAEPLPQRRDAVVAALAESVPEAAVQGIAAGLHAAIRSRAGTTRLQSSRRAAVAASSSTRFARTCSEPACIPHDPSWVCAGIGGDHPRGDRRARGGDPSFTAGDVVYAISSTGHEPTAQSRPQGVWIL